MLELDDLHTSLTYLAFQESRKARSSPGFVVLTLYFFKPQFPKVLNEGLNWMAFVISI